MLPVTVDNNSVSNDQEVVEEAHDDEEERGEGHPSVADSDDQAESWESSQTEVIGATDSDYSSNDDNELIPMQIDRSTGLQRDSSGSQRQPNISSISNRLRRQHRRMTSSSPTSSSRAGRRIREYLDAGTQTRAKPPVVDEKTQSELRRKIMDIQRDSSISSSAKASLIQKLLSPASTTPMNVSKSAATGPIEATEKDLETTYNVSMKCFGT
ncbi:hypothetical protein BGZ94_000655 [Podila epigama]|nr:hypothetical protein BGZ94_000655 [Podila epigama]